MATIPAFVPNDGLTDCDREPIHIPGAIQPHGLLLVVDQAGVVVAGAGALEERLSPDWLGASVDALLGCDLAALLNPLPAGPNATMPEHVEGLGERFATTVHRSGGQLLIELEPVGTGMTAAATLAWLDAIASGFERATDLQGLCERAAVAFRTLTGFDRVMVYRFIEDEAGRVIAEDRAPGLGSFLHHHFPAGDIPVQARALYVRNRTRAIPDINYVPAPLRPAGFATLDLSDVAVRSVSPIHLQYLANMGVAASASISIVKDGLLWGLIACHHDAPRQLPPDIRAAAATLASGLARQVRAKEEAEAYRERLRLRAVEDTVSPKFFGLQPVRQSLAAAKDDLRALLGAGGFAIVADGAVDCDGLCPPAEVIAAAARWAQERGSDVVATHEMGAMLPLAAAHRDRASGVLALAFPQDGLTLVWLRAEWVEEIEWAGNPHKGASGTAAALTPRASFDSWTEIVRGRARRWTLEEIEAAHRLRRSIHDAQQHQRIRALNQEYQRAIVLKDAALAQKDLLMKEVNHRVQNSLQLVAAFLRLQAREAGGDTAAHLVEAQARLSAVALVHRRLYRDDQIESVDLSRYIAELVGDMKQSLGGDWANRMRLDLAPVLIPTDRAVDIGLILTELVINATKYAYDGAAGPISIALEQHRDRFRLIVADDGRGKGEGAGFGSRMMSAMVQRLDGAMEFADNAPGLRVILTAPIGEVALT